MRQGCAIRKPVCTIDDAGLADQQPPLVGSPAAQSLARNLQGDDPTAAGVLPSTGKYFTAYVAAHPWTVQS